MPDSTRILIVEPDPVAAAALVKMLARHGHRCEVVHDATHALERVQDTLRHAAEAFGVVITEQDLDRPGEGVDLIRQLRQNQNDLVPVVMTGFARIESAVRAMRRGAADYLTKPMIEAELLDAIDRATQAHLLVAGEDEPAEEPAGEQTTTITHTPAGTDAWTPMPLTEAMKEPERRIILAALEANGWNRQQTARQLGINRTTLYKKIRQHRLDEPTAD